jgi:serine phosphatase RsbU (regulator of sigma subunit)
VELGDGRGLLLGLTRDSRPTARVDLTDDMTALVLYTDGLIERRGERYDVGVARLIDACDGDDDRPLTAVRLADQLAEGARIDDDVTIVMVHFEPTEPLRTHPSTTSAGHRGN